MTGEQAPLATVFDESVGELELGIEWLPAGNSFCVSDSKNNGGVAVNPHLHVVVLEDFIFRIGLFRFLDVICARCDFAARVGERVIFHDPAHDSFGVALLIREGEIALGLQHGFFLACGLRGNTRHKNKEGRGCGADDEEFHRMKGE